jgi:hypothetical protein
VGQAVSDATQEQPATLPTASADAGTSSAPHGEGSKPSVSAAATRSKGGLPPRSPSSKAAAEAAAPSLSGKLSAGASGQPGPSAKAGEALPAGSEATDAKAGSALPSSPPAAPVVTTSKPAEPLPAASADSSLPLPAARRPTRTGAQPSIPAPALEPSGLTQPSTSGAPPVPADSADSAQRASARRPTRGRSRGKDQSLGTVPKDSAPLPEGSAQPAEADSADSGPTRRSSRRQARGKAAAAEHALASVPEEPSALAPKSAPLASADSTASGPAPPARKPGTRGGPRRAADSTLNAAPEEAAGEVGPHGIAPDVLLAGVPQHDPSAAVPPPADTPASLAGPTVPISSAPAVNFAALSATAVSAEAVAEPGRPKRRAAGRRADADAPSDAPALMPSAGTTQGADGGAASGPTLVAANGGSGPGGAVGKADQAGAPIRAPLPHIFSAIQGALAVMLPDGPPRDGDLLEETQANGALDEVAPAEAPTFGSEQVPVAAPPASLVLGRQNARKAADPTLLGVPKLATRDPRKKAGESGGVGPSGDANRVPEAASGAPAPSAVVLGDGNDAASAEAPGAPEQRVVVTREYTEVEMVVTEVPVPPASAAGGGIAGPEKEARTKRRAASRSGLSQARGKSAKAPITEPPANAAADHTHGPENGAVRGPPIRAYVAFSCRVFDVLSKSCLVLFCLSGAICGKPGSRQIHPSRLTCVPPWSPTCGPSDPLTWLDRGGR